jgi:hypothetical protein
MEETKLGKAIQALGKITIQEIREACNTHEVKDPQLTFYELSEVVEKLALLGFNINARKSSGEPRPINDICRDIFNIVVPFPEKVCFTGTENQIRRIKNLVEYYNRVYHAQIPLYDRKNNLRPIEQICDDLYLVADRVRSALESDDPRHGLKSRLRKLIEYNEEYTKISPEDPTLIPSTFITATELHGMGNTATGIAVRGTQIALAERLTRKPVAKKKPKKRKQKGKGREPVEILKIIAVDLNRLLNQILGKTTVGLLTEEFIWQLTMNGFRGSHVVFPDPTLADQYARLKEDLFCLVKNETTDGAYDMIQSVLQAVWMALLVSSVDFPPYYLESEACYIDAKKALELHQNLSAMKTFQIIVACAVLSGAVDHSVIDRIVTYIVSDDHSYEEVRGQIVNIFMMSPNQPKILSNIFQRMCNVNLRYTMKKIFENNIPDAVTQEYKSPSGNLFVTKFTSYNFTNKITTAEALDILSYSELRKTIVGAPTIRLTNTQSIIDQEERQIIFYVIMYLARRFAEVGILRKD